MSKLNLFCFFEWGAVRVEEKDHLTAQAARGDLLAIQQLLLAEHDRLAARIRRKLGSFNQITVDDVIQETFLRAFREIHRFKPGGEDSFYRWLATIAERHLTDLMRSAGRRKERQSPRPFPNDSLPDLLDRISGGERTPSRSIVRREAIAALQAGLAALPPDQRSAIRLRYLEALPVGEVAERLNRPDHAVHMLCYRGMRKLKDWLGTASQILNSRP